MPKSTRIKRVYSKDMKSASSDAWNEKDYCLRRIFFYEEPSAEMLAKYPFIDVELIKGEIDSAGFDYQDILFQFDY